MIKKLTRSGNSVALVLDKAILEKVGLGEGSKVEISTDGTVVVITPVVTRRRDAKLREFVQRMDRDYAGVFKKLAE